MIEEIGVYVNIIEIWNFSIVLSRVEIFSYDLCVWQRDNDIKVRYYELTCWFRVN